MGHSDLAHSFVCSCSVGHGVCVCVCVCVCVSVLVFVCVRGEEMRLCYLQVLLYHTTQLPICIIQRPSVQGTLHDSHLVGLCACAHKHTPSYLGATLQ